MATDEEVVSEYQDAHEERCRAYQALEAIRFDERSFVVDGAAINDRVFRAGERYKQARHEMEERGLLGQPRHPRVAEPEAQRVLPARR